LQLAAAPFVPRAAPLDVALPPFCRPGRVADMPDASMTAGADALVIQDELVQSPKPPSPWPPLCPTRMSCSTRWKTRASPRRDPLIDVMGILPRA
jgi:hypothetical protein